MSVDYINIETPHLAAVQAAPHDLAWYLVLAAPGYFILANSLAYVAFRIDKHRARAGSWRISETTLLLLALAGGSVGAKIGQHRFHHKTHKQPFRSLLNLVLVAQGGALIWFTGLLLGGLAQGGVH